MPTCNIILNSNKITKIAEAWSMKPSKLVADIVAICPFGFKVTPAPVKFGILSSCHLKKFCNHRGVMTRDVWEILPLWNGVKLLPMATSLADAKVSVLLILKVNYESIAGGATKEAINARQGWIHSLWPFDNTFAYLRLSFINSATMPRIHHKIDPEVYDHI